MVTLSLSPVDVKFVPLTLSASTMQPTSVALPVTLMVARLPAASGVGADHLDAFGFRALPWLSNRIGPTTHFQSDRQAHRLY